MTQFLSHFILIDLFIFTILILIYGFLKLILFLQVEACITQESWNLLIVITIESFCFRIFVLMWVFLMWFIYYTCRDGNSPSACSLQLGSNGALRGHWGILEIQLCMLSLGQFYPSHLWPYKGDSSFKTPDNHNRHGLWRTKNNFHCLFATLSSNWQWENPRIVFCL